THLSEMDDPDASTVFQPKAKTQQPQGQLAAFLRGRLDWEFDGVGSAKDINRSSSAPPTQILMPEPYKQEVEEYAASPSDPRLDPNYAAYYYHHSRLDPRLPPPIYQPGQSWQLWAPPGLSKQRSMVETPTSGKGAFAGDEFDQGRRFNGVMESDVGPSNAFDYPQQRPSESSRLVDPNLRLSTGLPDPRFRSSSPRFDPRMEAPRGIADPRTSGFGGNTTPISTPRDPSATGWASPAPTDLQAPLGVRVGANVVGLDQQQQPLGPGKRRNLIDITENQYARTPSPSFGKMHTHTMDDNRHILIREQMRADLESPNDLGPNADERMAAVLSAALDHRDDLLTGVGVPVRSASTPPGTFGNVPGGIRLAERGEEYLNGRMQQQQDLVSHMRGISLTDDDYDRYGATSHSGLRNPSKLNPALYQDTPGPRVGSPGPMLGGFNSKNTKSDPYLNASVNNQDAYGWELRQQTSSPSRFAPNVDTTKRNNFFNGPSTPGTPTFPNNAPQMRGGGGGGQRGPEPRMSEVAAADKRMRLAAQQQQMMREQMMMGRDGGGGGGGRGGFN
ncbi:hypothetical protein HDV05_008661, partial [Chytridiales sp. JEL 0842]